MILIVRQEMEKSATRDGNVVGTVLLFNAFLRFFPKVCIFPRRFDWLFSRRSDCLFPEGLQDASFFDPEQLRMTSCLNVVRSCSALSRSANIFLNVFLGRNNKFIQTVLRIVVYTPARGDVFRHQLAVVFRHQLAVVFTHQLADDSCLSRQLVSNSVPVSRQLR